MTSRLLCLVAVGIVVSGCATTHPGDAAVVGDTAITESSIGEQLRAINELTGKPADEPSEELTRAIVSYNVGHALIRQVAAEFQAEVPRAVLDQSYAQQVQQLGGEEQLKVAAAQSGIAPSVLRRDLETQLLVAAIANKVAPGADQSQQQPKLLEALTAQSEKLNIEVAPKYGEWDPATLQLGEVKFPVSRPQVAPTPAMAPQPQPQP